MVEKTESEVQAEVVTLIVNTVEVDGFFHVDLRHDLDPNKILATGVSRRPLVAQAYALSDLAARLLANSKP